MLRTWRNWDFCTLDEDYGIGCFMKTGNQSLLNVDFVRDSIGRGWDFFSKHGKTYLRARDREDFFRFINDSRRAAHEEGLLT